MVHKIVDCPKDCPHMEAETTVVKFPRGSEVQYVSARCTLYNEELEGTPWTRYRATMCRHNEHICPNCGHSTWVRTELDVLEKEAGFVDKWRRTRCRWRFAYRWRWPEPVSRLGKGETK